MTATPQHPHAPADVIERNMVRLKGALVAALIAGFGFSMRLWTGPRDFPRAPVLPSLAAIPAPVELIAFAVLIIILLAIGFSSRPRKLIIAALLLAALLACLDQLRWQPWFYQYMMMLAAIGLVGWNGDEETRRRAVMNSCRLIVVSIYVYSGLQKLNPGFMRDVFPWMISPVTNVVPAFLRLPIVSLGYAVPFIEIGIGVWLLIRALRPYAVVFAILMSVFILAMLGPWGQNWNSVVWPWNIAMALFAVILFWRTDDFPMSDVFHLSRDPVRMIILVLFVVMPALSFFNLWDSYLSSTLYSGNTNSAQITVSDAVRSRLPKNVQQYVMKIGSDRNLLDFFTWSYAELNVPPYPETRVYKAIARGICGYATTKDNVTLAVRGKPTVWNADQGASYDCSML